jgi:hypothetical protein
MVLPFSFARRPPSSTALSCLRNAPRGLHDQLDGIHNDFAAFGDTIGRVRPALFIHGYQHADMESIAAGTQVRGEAGGESESISRSQVQAMKAAGVMRRCNRTGGMGRWHRNRARPRHRAGLPALLRSLPPGDGDHGTVTPPARPPTKAACFFYLAGANAVQPRRLPEDSR